MISDALSSDLISKIVGYKLTKGDFRESSPNLPIKILVLGEANTANQGSLSTDLTEVTTAQRAGELYGFGSPIYSAMRILRPVTSEGVGGIPTIVAAQAEPGGATSKIMQIGIVGVANGNGTHFVKVAGRNGIDGEFYAINIVEGDTANEISTKIEDAVNGILGAPVTASTTGYDVDLETKWAGLTADELDVQIDTGDDSLDITYSVSTTQNGSGTPSISAALTGIGSEWIPIVVNTYGTESTILTTLEQFNGKPDPNTPTGRYAGTIFKPFIAVTGSTADDPSSVTDSRADDVTIAIAPAPNSKGFHFEAAANATYLLAIQAQNRPHLDISGQSYPDMPTPVDIGSMDDYVNRNAIVKKGCSTVQKKSGQYEVADFVTTYHPAGENPPQFRYVRALIQDFNIYYGYFLLEQINVVDHSIANDADLVDAVDVIKPKQWLAIIDAYAEELALRSLIADPAFMQNSIQVGISETNPDRFETFFKYKRTGYVRLASTTVQAGFNFG
jgi:phage tail sheath gpL-like